MAELIAIGKIVKASGVRGEVSVVPLTHSPERFRSLRSVFVGQRAEAANRIAVTSVKTNPGGVVIHLAGVDSREKAKRHREEFVFVHRDDVEPPREGSYLIADLEGLEVVTESGQKLGVVRDVLEMPAQDLWVVWDGQHEWQVPGVSEFIKDVDLAKRRVVVRLIEGIVP